ncbi:MAG: hypothetical protein HZB76_01300 [Chlamydiae bacterium]|nr:hypothetical protein [Chlamydiota bacterium]
MPRAQLDAETPLVTRENTQSWCFANRKLWGTISIVCGAALFIFAIVIPEVLCEKCDSKAFYSSVSFQLGMFSGLGSVFLCGLGVICSKSFELSSIGHEPYQASAR